MDPLTRATSYPMPDTLSAVFVSVCSTSFFGIADPAVKHAFRPSVQTLVKDKRTQFSRNPTGRAKMAT